MKAERLESVLSSSGKRKGGVVIRVRARNLDNELWVLTIPQKAKVLEDGKCIARGGTEACVVPSGRLINLSSLASSGDLPRRFLDNLVDDEHDHVLALGTEGRPDLRSV
jgi:hypothetical protein